MASRRKLNFTSAVTGAIRTPSMSSQLPVMLERSREVVFNNTFADIETILGTTDEAREMLPLKGRDKVAV